VNRILVVGFGSIGKRHVRIVRKLYPQMTIGVLRHASCDETVTSDGWVNQCFTSIHDALAFHPEAAIIASPASFHVQASVQLAEAGIHLLVEKPLSSGLKNVSQLIELCETRGVTLAVGYNLRFLPSLMAFRNHIKSGVPGKVFSVRAEVGQYLPGWRVDSDYRNTASAQRELGGGVLLELSHEIDYLCWILGRPSWVMAQVSRLSNLEIDVEDTAHLILGVSDEQDNTSMVSLNMDFIRHDTTRQCHVIGEQGTLQWNAIEGEVNFYSETTRQWETLHSSRVDRDYTYEEEIKDFIDSIENHHRPVVDGRDGLQTLEVIEAARNSALQASRQECK